MVPLFLLSLLLLPALGCQQTVEERMEQVRALHELGSWEESADELRAVLEEQPDHPEANYLLGVSQLRQGQASLAIWPLQMAKRDPELAVDADLMLAIAYLSLEQYELAIESAGQVLEAGPESTEQRAQAHRMRARAYWEQDRAEDALEDTTQLVALRPDDPSALALHANAQVGAGRHEEAEQTLRSMWEAEPDRFPTAAVAQAGLGLVRLFGDELEQPEAAERQLEAVLERHPANPTVVREAVSFFDEREAPERASEVLQEALEVAPTDLELRILAAHRRGAQGEIEEGEALLVEGTELLGSPTAWLALERYRRQHGDLVGALEAVERTLELVPEPTAALRFKHADLLISNAALDRAESVAAELGDSVYGDVIRGRLAFERGRYEEALEHLDAGLQRWPNNPGARHLAGKAAFVLGRLDRALSDLKEAVRATLGNSDAGLDLARIHLARGEPEKAAPFALRTFRGSNGPGGDPARAREALLLAVEALGEQGRVQQARQRAAQLAALPEGARPAALALGSLLAKARGPGAAADLLAQTELDLTDPENAVVLRALGQYQVDAGRAEEAVQQVEAALEASPEVPAFHDALGRVLVHAGRPADARRAFERALELDPEHAPALEGLARIAQAEGELARARELLDRAADTDAENAEYVYAAAQLALASGDAAGAEERLRETLQREPSHPQASNDLAWILAERGEQLDDALVLARRAAAARPTANVLDTLGWVQLRRGEAQAALETFERAHALDPESASIAYRLGLALAEVGQTDRARSLLEQALASGAFPESEEAREQLARLDGSGS